MSVSSFKAFAAIAALLVIGVVVAHSLSKPACTLLNGAASLSINLSDVAPGTVRAFCYEERAGQKLRFLLARDTSGELHAAFDACEQCYKFHKGYTYSHGYLICRLCGNRYRVKNMNTGQASCVPVSLASKTAGGRVKIKVADVEAGKWLF